MTTEAPKKPGRKSIPNHPLEFRREIAKLASEPGVSVARLAMEHRLNTNLVFKWRRALHASEYDPVDLLPVKVDAALTEVAPPASIPAPVTAPSGAIEISVGNSRVRIDGVPDERTLMLVLRMLRGMSGAAA
ncbi:putative transposition-related protein [Caballeronia sordidicola]|uniref:Putative transposition-related protein n=1 Tax=Caballeronia sordidicola TaxID=196367 RepID=A0A242MS05_CABSO|nr:putative transposition-related protein [Caballeronia sordidicola]